MSKQVKIVIELTIDNFTGKVKGNTADMAREVETIVGGGQCKALADFCWARGSFADAQVVEIISTKENSVKRYDTK